MKGLTKIIFILIVVCFLTAPFGVLNAEEKKDEKAGESDLIENDTARIKAEYKEKTYYFCSEKCKAEFEKDPEKFLEKCKDKLKGCEGEIFYICPMKQCAVKTDKPGKCPKCGMELKRVVTHAGIDKKTKSRLHGHGHGHGHH